MRFEHPALRLSCIMTKYRTILHPSQMQMKELTTSAVDKSRSILSPPMTGRAAYPAREGSTQEPSKVASNYFWVVTCYVSSHGTGRHSVTPSSTDRVTPQRSGVCVSSHYGSTWLINQFETIVVGGKLPTLLARTVRV